VASERKPADALAVSMMVVLCMSWGFQQITIKIAAAGVSPIMQAGLRSIIATVLLLAWVRLRRIPAVQARRHAGAAWRQARVRRRVRVHLAGLAYTSASRMVVFIYLAPCLTALGTQWFVPGERLNAGQWTVSRSPSSAWPWRRQPARQARP
jgi:drug/metabolite transporter (DMT)-like permease